MRYLCVHCDHRFDVEGTDVPSRCPNCMRATGVKALVEPSVKAPSPSAGASNSRKFGLGLLGISLLAAGFGAWAWERNTPPPALDDVSAWSDRQLESVLSAQQVDAGGLEKLLVADDAIEAFAEQAVAGSGDTKAKGQAITQALRARASAQGFKVWSLGEPRPSAPFTAAETLKRIQKDGAREELYPLEVAALAVSALRSVDVPAGIAELVQVPGERAPLEGAGYLGYFVVAIPEGEGVLWLDPYGGRTLSGAEKVSRVSDAAAVGAALSLRAIYEVAYAGDPKSALQTSSHALKLAAQLPTVRTARGVIVLSGKMVEQGLQEFTAASQMRADAPRLHNLASAKLMLGDFDGAGADLTRALDKAPDFAAARATLGAISMLRGDVDGALVAFDAAEKLAPDLSLVQWGKAEFLLRSGDRSGALERAKDALDHRPSFDAKVRYAVILRQAGRYEEMRHMAHGLVKQVPQYRKDEVREMVVALLGPTALDPVELDPSAEDLADLGGPDLDLKLEANSKMLNAPESAPVPGDAQSGEPLLMLGDPKKLRLGGESSRLKLNLGD